MKLKVTKKDVRQNVQVAIPSDLYQWLEDLSERTGCTRANVITQILEQAKQMDAVELDETITERTKA